MGYKLEKLGLGQLTPDAFFALAGCTRPTDSIDRGCSPDMITRAHISVEGWTGGAQKRICSDVVWFTNGLAMAFTRACFNGKFWLRSCSTDTGIELFGNPLGFIRVLPSPHMVLDPVVCGCV